MEDIDRSGRSVSVKKDTEEEGVSGWVRSGSGRDSVIDRCACANAQTPATSTSSASR